MQLITSLIIPKLRNSMFIYSGAFLIFIDYKLNCCLLQNRRNWNKINGWWNVKWLKFFPIFIYKITVRKIIKQHISHVKMSEDRTTTLFHFEENISLAKLFADIRWVRDWCYPRLILTFFIIFFMAYCKYPYWILL